MIRSYSELRQIDDFIERFRYLSLQGAIGESSFGSNRWLNQEFYRSGRWKAARRRVIARDSGCDLGIEGREIFDNLQVHHMNPMTIDQVIHGDPDILDPEFLITTSQITHEAIHFGDEKSLPRPFVDRFPGDTKLW